MSDMATISLWSASGGGGGGGSDTPQQIWDKIKDYAGTFTNKTISGKDNTLTDLPAVTPVESLPVSDIDDDAIYGTRRIVYVRGGAIVQPSFYVPDGTTMQVAVNPDTNAKQLQDIASSEFISDGTVLSDIATYVQEGYVLASDYAQSSVSGFAIISTDYITYEVSADIDETAFYEYWGHAGGEWRLIASTLYPPEEKAIDGTAIHPSTTRQDLHLVGEDDIRTGSGTPKAQGIDIFLGAGDTPDPDIIQDGQNFRYAQNKTSSNYYLNTRMDAIQAQAEGSNKTYFIDYPGTLPSAGSRTLNAYYYIQIASGGTNYQRYFIDSTDVSHDLGTTEVNLSTMVPKTDVVVPDSSSTTGKVADAKGVYDNYAPLSGVYGYGNNATSYLAEDCVFNFHYQSGTNRSSEEKLFSNVRIVYPTTRTGYIYGTLKTIQCQQASDTVAIIQEFYYSIGAGSTGLCNFYRVGKVQAGWNQVVDNKANIVWQDWIPLEPLYAIKGSSSALSLDNCLFNVPKVVDSDVRFNKRYFTNVTITCPIAGSSKFYRVETTIDNMQTQHSSVITQVATRITNAGVTSPEVLKRVGLLSYHATNVPDVSQVYTYRSQIVWKNWYPVEYPKTALTLKTGITGNVVYSVSGGNMTVFVRDLLSTEASGEIVIADVPDLPYKLYTSGSTSYIEGQVNSVDGTTPRGMQFRTTLPNTRNLRIFNLPQNGQKLYGSMTVPLGY